jgi:MFS family permease
MVVTAMAWVPRIPEITGSLGLSDGEFGLVLVSSSFGAIIWSQLSGRLIQKLGSKALLRIARLSMPLGVIMTG